MYYVRGALLLTILANPDISHKNTGRSPTASARIVHFLSRETVPLSEAIADGSGEGPEQLWRQRCIGFGRVEAPVVEVLQVRRRGRDQKKHMDRTALGAAPGKKKKTCGYPRQDPCVLAMSIPSAASTANEQTEKRWMSCLSMPMTWG